MMLIIDIHVDTVEDTNPSTRKIREDERPKRVKNSSKKTENRFWNAIKLSFPDSLIPQDENKR
jgi:hypothetical protein